MNYNYTKLKINISSSLFEIISAELADIGYEGFVENDDYLEAYIISKFFNKNEVLQILLKYGIDENKTEISEIGQQNWNEEWESNFEPIEVNNKIIVKAPFHKIDKGYEFELIIQPKTSFGTGHHETTYLMLKSMMDIDFKQKTVFDYGCGTGILAIFASKLGTNKIEAIDIDSWAAENVLENMRLNHIENILFIQCDLTDFETNLTYDIILANINKNILISSFERLSTLLVKNGLLLISGFYENDLSDLINQAVKFGLHYQNNLSKNNWCCASFVKV
ncbi:MAG: 50S ribosomal protein L11 methyltransferase [Bacteroidia bacterium]